MMMMYAITMQTFQTDSLLQSPRFPSMWLQMPRADFHGADE